MNAKEVYEQCIKRLMDTHLDERPSDLPDKPAWVFVSENNIILRYKDGTWTHLAFFDYMDTGIEAHPLAFNQNNIALYHKAGLISQQEYPSVNLLVRQAGAYLATLSALTTLEQSASDLATPPVWLNQIREMRDQLVDDYHHATEDEA